MKTAEAILREYIQFDDVNGSETVELLPLTIVDAMLEFASQSKWIAVEERLPEIGQEVLTYRPLAEYSGDPIYKVATFTGINHHSPQQVEHGFDCWCHPIFWQLIEPPKQ